MRIPNFNLFDTMAAAGIYDPASGNPKTNLHHIPNGNHSNVQHIYPSTNDYNSSSSIPTSNGYWPYSTPSYFPAPPRQYMINQTSSTSVSDTCSSLTEQNLPYHTHGSYAQMQKMVGNYPTNYEFYPQHNAKYC